MFKEFFRKGVTRNVLARDIGKRAVRFLGIKPADTNTPMNIMSNLELSIGTAAIQGLMNTGLVVEEKIQVDRIRTADIPLTGFPTELPVYRFQYETEQGAMSNTSHLGFKGDFPIGAILEANKGSQNVFTKAFGGTYLKDPPPSFTPTTNKQLKAKGSDRLVPSALRKLFTRKGSEKSFLDMSQYNLIKSLGREAFLRINGWLTEEEVNALQAELRESALARNMKVELDYDNYMEWVATLETQAEKLSAETGEKVGIGEVPWYYNFAIWQNFRVGLANSIFNPQASKFHRFAAYMQSWEQTINLDDTKRLDEFYGGVAEALKINADQNRLHGVKDKPGVLDKLFDLLATEEAKASNLQSDTDLKDLDFVEQESGVKQEREKELRAEQANSQARLAMLNNEYKRESEHRSHLKDYLLKKMEISAKKNEKTSSN